MSLARLPRSPLPNAPSRQSLPWDAVAVVLALADFASIFLAATAVQYAYYYVAFGVREPLVTASLAALLLAAIFTAIATAQQSYRYERLLPSSRPIERAIAIWCISLFVLFAVLFITKTSAQFSRGSVVVLFVAGLALVTLLRAAAIQVLMRLTRSAVVAARRTMLVGPRDRIESFLAAEQPANLGIAIVATFFLSRGGSERLSEDLNRVVHAARHSCPDDIMLVLPWAETDWIRACTHRLMELPVGIQLAPEALFRMFPRAATARIGELTSLSLVHRPLNRLDVCMKRLVDIVLSATALVVLAPLLLIIALAIKLDSRGPVLFRQRRHGFNRREFEIFKFRSMHASESSAEFRQARANDDRVTRVGRILRKTNLDELPQLFNVFLGSMSLVGPRPHPVALDESYLDRIALYSRRHNMKPGMTGWAQVNGFRGETAADVQMRARLVCDIYYLDNWSIGFDLVILFWTVFSRKAFRNAV